MDAKYISCEEEKEFYTEERCHILELFNFADCQSHSVARARVVPGVKTAWHRLNGTSEILYFLAGNGRVELDEKFVQSIRPGEAVFIPQATPQRVVNTGETDLLFLCICVPAFRETCYEALE